MATLVSERIRVPDRDLSQMTLCLRVQMGSLGNSRKVSSARVDVDADKNLIRVTKRLLDARELQAISSFDNALRQSLYQLCLPYDIGIQLVPYEMVEEVDAKLMKAKGERLALVEAFLAVYPSLCRQISMRLRTLYNPADYPPMDYVRSKFTLDWTYWKFGVPAELSEISPRIFASEREKAAQRIAEATLEIQQILRTTLAQMVDRLRERLSEDESGRPKQLRDSAVEKLKEFLATFDIRNVTDDRELAREVSKARQLLDGVSADTIRDTDTLRDRIRSGMEEIGERLDSMIVERPKRKFRFPVE